MATYITLCQWTRKGAKNLKDSPSRLDAVKEAARAAGGEMKSFYMTMGEYDLVIVWEFPDDKACAKVTLGVMRQGNVRSQTLKAFPESDYREILAST